MELPRGFGAYVANIGIKDTTTDFVVVAAESVCPAAGVFTQSRFSGPSVRVSRENIASQSARAVVVISKNANVATGEHGLNDTREIIVGVANRLGCDPNHVLIASTGVIGRMYPMDNVRAGMRHVPASPSSRDVDAVARAIMTTDTIHKVAESIVVGSNARIVGVAKGVGMIEPNMATLITLMFTDALIEGAELDKIFRRVIDKTFNCLSIDTDTSTSDTAIILAGGAAGNVDLAKFEQALYEVALALTRQVARDGEGAEKLIEVCVDGARDEHQAKLVAKSIVNSPLVKTAVHGADPNWGRVAMAIGKCSEETDIDQRRVVIRFGPQEVYPTFVDTPGVRRVKQIHAR